MHWTWAAIAVMAAAASASASDGKDIDVAQRFGARESVINLSIAPDGKRVAYVMAGVGSSTSVIVANADGTNPKTIARADGKPFHITECGWTAPTRLACRQSGISMIGNVRAPFSRLVALDADGGNVVPLARRTGNQARVSQFDGRVIDWLSGDDGMVLMERDYVPEGQNTMGYDFPSQSFDGLGVDRVNTANGRGKSIERPVAKASEYIADGRGNVRIVAVSETDAAGRLTGITSYRYRLSGDATWKPFSRTGAGEPGLQPVAVDGTSNLAYALRPLDGRDALYRVSLDGTLRAELVHADPNVDVAGVVTIGRRGRVIGASYVTDRRQISYFDPDYRQLAQSLSRVLPKLPLIYFLGASADEQRVLVFAGSDVDPGHHYVFDRATRRLDELHPARAELVDAALSPVSSVSYRTADGTVVPAYLTLPPGGKAKGLPAIVLPHGGPASRDEWGFDWLAQYLAQRGFAVLQPQFRGSSGYGDAWYVENGFKSWKTAVGDISDGARWMQQQGIADPQRTAIAGWSYGGYAALQASAVDPALFKAVVAIAPVTSLTLLKKEAQVYTNGATVARFVGDGPHGAPWEFLQPCTLRKQEVLGIEAVGADRAVSFEGAVNLVPEIVAGGLR